MDYGMFNVGPATKQDVKEITRLIQEAKDQKKEMFPRRIGEDDLLRDGFGDKQHFFCLVAKQKSQSKNHSLEDHIETGELIIGFVLYFYLFSTWEGHFLFIDDLLISSKYKEQHKIINLLLIRECARIAVEENCCRLQFDILRDDSTSVERFSPMGGFTLPEWLTVRFPTDALITMASKENKDNSKKFKIRSATIEDMPSIMYMIQSLADFENMSHVVEIGTKVLNKSFEKYFKCIIGESLTPISDSDDCNLISSKMPHDNRIAGMAVYLTIYCKRVGKVLHLEDLFVLPQYRNQGLGTELMKECAKIGLSCGCTEMDLQVLDWNTKAVDLYKRLGGVFISELVPLRFTKDKIPPLASLEIEDVN